MSGLGGLWESLVDAVCRPPRDSDYTDEELVGGKKAVFTWQGGRYYRQDLQVWPRFLVKGSLPGVSEGRWGCCSPDSPRLPQACHGRESGRVPDLVVPTHAMI